MCRNDVFLLVFWGGFCPWQRCFSKKTEAHQSLSLYIPLRHKPFIKGKPKQNEGESDGVIIQRRSGISQINFLHCRRPRVSFLLVNGSRIALLPKGGNLQADVGVSQKLCISLASPPPSRLSGMCRNKWLTPALSNAQEWRTEPS